jgi:hypothetical protein
MTMRSWFTLDERTRSMVRTCGSCNLGGREPASTDRVYVCEFHDGFDLALDLYTGRCNAEHEADDDHVVVCGLDTGHLGPHRSSWPWGVEWPSGTVVHQCPPPDSGTMPCCGRTPFEVKRTDRITMDEHLVTCGRV